MKKHSRLSGLLFSTALLCSASIHAYAAVPIPDALADEQGTIEIIHEDYDTWSKFRYFLNTPAAERFELDVQGKKPDHLKTGDKVRVRGKKSGNVLSADGSTLQAVALANPNTFGAQKTAVIMVNFNDTTYPYTASSVLSVLKTTSDYNRENSFGQTWMVGVANPTAPADVFGVYSINQSKSVCDYNTTATLTKQAATAAGVNLSLYTRYIYVFPKNVCTWGGLGTVGGNPSQSWINGSLSLRIVAHEFGHNLGLWHSHSMSCASGSCTTSDYGDLYDIMGSSNYGHFNPYQKERLGWLNYNISPPITTVLADGEYQLTPYEAQDTASKALKFLKSVSSTGQPTYYYVQYNTPLGFDASVPSGVYLHVGTENSGDTSYIWDLDQATSTSDWKLDIGQTYIDPIANKSITLVGVSGSIATVSIGTPIPCSAANPSLQLSPANNTVAAGGTTSYSLNIANNDVTGCPAANFSLAALLPPGVSASIAPSNLSLQPRTNGTATMTVSASSSLAQGAYNFTTTVSRAGDSGASASATGTLNVVVPTIAISTDKLSYLRSETVTVYSLLTAGTAPVAGASVAIMITKPDGSVRTSSVVTDSNGYAVYGYKFGRRDPQGTYTVQASALNKTATTSFTMSGSTSGGGGKPSRGK